MLGRHVVAALAGALAPLSEGHSQEAPAPSPRVPEIVTVGFALERMVALRRGRVLLQSGERKGDPRRQLRNQPRDSRITLNTFERRYLILRKTNGFKLIG
jgi:hypothetical protein